MQSLGLLVRPSGPQRPFDHKAQGPIWNQTIASESLTHTSKFDVFGPKPQCQTDRKFTRLLAVLVTNHFAGSWHRLSAAEPSKDPSAAGSSGQLGISCKVLVGAKSAANSQLVG